MINDQLIDFVSIDPGVNASGIATWRGNQLIAARYYKPSGQWVGYSLVIEKPQIYQGRKQKGDPNDLIDLAIEVGVLSTLFSDGTVTLVKPREWKGQVPKEVMLKRILSKLTADELQLIKGLGLSKSQSHNVVDAVGIGLWALGRL